MLSQLGWSRTEFIARTGVSQQLVNAWLKRGGVGKDSHRIVRDAAGVSIEWLNDGVGDPFPNSYKVAAFTVRGVDGPDGVDREREAMIPVLDVELSAGSNEDAPSVEFLPTRFERPYDLGWMQTQGARPKDILIMPVRGRSMEPVLWHGDLIVLHRGRQRVHDGAVYGIVTHPGGARVKRLYNTPDGGLRIVSDNEDKRAFPDELVPRERRHCALILGEAIDRHGPGGLRK